jgi:hypothetical protein
LSIGIGHGNVLQIVGIKTDWLTECYGPVLVFVNCLVVSETAALAVAQAKTNSAAKCLRQPKSYANESPSFHNNTIHTDIWHIFH